jgi:uncharacterized phage protein (TIGR01671 family)
MNVKFRIWNKDKKIYFMSNTTIGINNNNKDIWGDVELFTGLKDKKGKEIFKGDILKIESDKPMVVGWSERFASFILTRDGWAFSHWFGESCDPSDCEVIGNKNENLELLS